MFAGHAAIAGLLGATRSRVPLAPLVVAAYAADAIEIILNAMDVAQARAMFASHALISMAVGATIAWGLTLLTTRRRDLALLVGAAYLSHWPADLLTGSVKPTWPGGPTFGLGLYERPWIDFVLESMLVAASALALRHRRPRARVVRVALLLVALQLGFAVTKWMGWGLKKDIMRATDPIAARRSVPGHTAGGCIAGGSGGSAWLLHRTARTSTASVRCRTT